MNTKKIEKSKSRRKSIYPVPALTKIKPPASLYEIMVHEKKIKIFITQVLEEKEKMDVKNAAKNFCITVSSDVAFFFPLFHFIADVYR